ncbi:MAG: class I SAM-dependent methyltransferase [Solirubrobacterales bacterium]
MADWGEGTYELTAAQLAPVAVEVVDAVEPVAGLKTLDLACGTGNAALIAAERTAEVTGFDAATRLLEVAAGRSAEAGLDVSWVEGDMHDLPYPDDTYDRITSVFGVIFGDPQKVAAEIARVIGVNGRLAFTTWTNEGLLPRISDLNKKAVAEALDHEVEPMQFQWGDETELRELFSEHGIVVQCKKEKLTFTADSAEAANEEWREHHPMWLAVKELVGDERFDALSKQILEELRNGNESTDGGFSYSSSYLIAVGTPV